jgi:nucleotide-binding universal stress UspA family protein
MKYSNHILLASHGTDGAKAAERQTLQMCAKGSRIHHLFVVPDFWKGMTGDDWLNNGSTRNRFRDYLESELEGEVREHIARLQEEAQAKEIDYSAEVMVGKPEQCLIEASKQADYDMVVMGSPRPKGIKGLRSRMTTEPLLRNLTSPLLIVPYPNV